MYLKRFSIIIVFLLTACGQKGPLILSNNSAKTPSKQSLQQATVTPKQTTKKEKQ